MLRIALAMVAKKPGSPGRARRKPLKPFAQGRPDDLRRTCGDYACVLFSFAREAAGAACARLSLRPRFSWADSLIHSSDALRRENLGVCLNDTTASEARLSFGVPDVAQRFLYDAPPQSRDHVLFVDWPRIGSAPLARCAASGAR